MLKDNNRYILNIKQFCNADVTISNPEVSGKIHNVFIVQYQNKKTVFRFSQLECALRNADISRILTRHGFNVPWVSVVQIGSEYCEVYPYIQGKTLSERAKHGISPEQIKKIYNQLIEISYDLAAIPTNEIKEDYNINTRWQDKAKNIFFNSINHTQKQICHTDLHQGNILLDNQDNVCAILDLDGINKGSLELAIFNIMYFAQSYGYTFKDLKYYYPKTYDGKFFNMEQQLKIYSTARTVYRLMTGQYIKNKLALQKR